MLSLEGRKSSTLIGRIRQHEDAPVSYENVFSSDDLGAIEQIRRRCYGDIECQYRKSEGGEISKGTVAVPNPIESQFLEELIKSRAKLRPDCRLSFSFHRNFFPYGIHTDSGYDSQELIYKQGIIPLEVLPANEEVYTVIFDQKCYHSASYPRDPDTIAAMRPEEVESVWGLSGDTSVSEKDCERFWDSEHWDWLKGFTVALAFQWRIGSMAVWDRSHFHCSSDFKRVRGKIGLMWVSSLPN